MYGGTYFVYLKILGSILCKIVNALFVFLKLVQEPCYFVDKFPVVLHPRWIFQTN